MEQWKKIKGYPYEISNFGRIKSLERYIGNKGYNRVVKQKILKGIINNGYYCINLYNKENQKQFRVNVLVIEYFGPPKPSAKHICNHKDGDKLFNHIDNLEWATPSENRKHAFMMGLQSTRGEKNNQAKLTEKKVKRIRNLYKTGKYTQKELGNMFDVTSQNISRIINNKIWVEIQHEVNRN